MKQEKIMLWGTVGLHILNSLLVGAHFLRSGQILPSTFCLMIPLLFLYRHRISLILLQIFSCVSAAVWLHTAGRLIMLRMAQNQSWKVATLILGIVALISLLAGLLLNGPSLRERYPK